MSVSALPMEINNFVWTQMAGAQREILGVLQQLTSNVGADSTGAADITTAVTDLTNAQAEVVVQMSTIDTSLPDLLSAAQLLQNCVKDVITLINDVQNGHVTFGTFVD